MDYWGQAMRRFKIVVFALILVTIVLLSLANRELVTVELLPEPLDRVLSASVEVPLFLVILVSVLVGMILGYTFEWLREARYRRAAAQRGREASALAEELHRIKQRGKPADDVLALIN